MLIFKNGISREISSDRLNEFLEKGYKQVKKTSSKKTSSKKGG